MYLVRVVMRGHSRSTELEVEKVGGPLHLHLVWSVVVSHRLGLYRGLSVIVWLLSFLV
jgi:hypothetical protein